jgi:enoyl-CoA hydratase
MSDLALYQVDGRVAIITLNRPDKLNALNDDLYAAFFEALDRAQADDDVTVLVLRGAGTSFSTGHDLTQVSTVYEGWTMPAPGERVRRPSQRSRLMTDRRRLSDRWARLFNFPKVTIAQVHGYCIEGGCNLQLMCDITIAAEDAVFSYRGQRLAAGGASTPFLHLVNVLGYKKARELILTGRSVSGAEAAEIGLVNRAVPAAELESETMEMARMIALTPRDAIVMGKFYSSLVYDEIGLNSWNTLTIGHTLATNIRFDPDEYNYHKEKRDRGPREAFHGLHDRYDGAPESK